MVWRVFAWRPVVTRTTFPAPTPPGLRGGEAFGRFWREIWRRFRKAARVVRKGQVMLTRKSRKLRQKLRTNAEAIVGEQDDDKSWKQRAEVGFI